MDNKTHLVKSVHDVTLTVTAVWCEGGSPYHDESSECLEFVTCEECLAAAVKHGEECAARLRALKGGC